MRVVGCCRFIFFFSTSLPFHESTGCSPCYRNDSCQQRHEPWASLFRQVSAILTNMNINISFDFCAKSRFITAICKTITEWHSVSVKSRHQLLVFCSFQQLCLSQLPFGASSNIEIHQTTPQRTNITFLCDGKVKDVPFSFGQMQCSHTMFHFHMASVKAQHEGCNSLQAPSFARHFKQDNIYCSFVPNLNDSERLPATSLLGWHLSRDPDITHEQRFLKGESDRTWKMFNFTLLDVLKAC